MNRYIPLCFLALFITYSCEKTDPPEDKDGFTDPRDGYTYSFKTIGNQIWMTENLRYLPKVSPPDQESVMAEYYYVLEYLGHNVEEAKSTSNFQTYGALYNWISAMDACPEGWHLPSAQEIEELINFLGGWATAGKKMKSGNGWNVGFNGDNTSGFNALPAGCAQHPEFKGVYTEFWAIDEIQTYDMAFTYQLNAGDEILETSLDQYLGISVRCIKD